MSSAPTAERLKKVMRIALVGVRPADQVLLKGYLRVLLRLEADLEWVSANSPQVDLFMINQEFQQAESVKKLLAGHQRVPALYIARDEHDQGHLVGNLLTLPLKEIDYLNQWLFTNVHFLQAHGENKPSVASNHPTTQPTATAANTSAPQTLEQIIASRNQAALASTSPPQATTLATAPAAAAATINTLISTLKTLQQRQDSLFILRQADTLIAYVNPKFQRVWVIDNTIHLNTAWTLVPTSEQPPILSQNPIDLVQWLWEKSTTTPTPVTSLVQAGQRYRMTSWIKPLDDEHRHDNLKIQGVLESRDSTLDEIIQVAHVSRELVLRSVSGFIISGVMTPNVYTNLPTVASSPVSPSSLSQPTQPYIQPTSPPPTSPAPQPSAPVIEQTRGQDDGMKGFLSKLRRKLGL